ncbi:MAG: flippase [Patescibacteria group bacterium]
MSFTRAVAHNTIVQTIGKAISTLLGLITFALLARYLGQEGYGHYYTVLSYLGFFSVLADFGLYIIVARELGRKEKPEGEILGNLLALRLVLAFIILSIGIVLSLFFPYPGVVKISILVGAANFLFIAVIQLLVGLFQAHLNTFWVVFGEIIGRLVVIGLVLLIISNAGALPWIIAAVVLGSFSNFVIMLLATRRFVRLSLKFDMVYWRYILRETFPIAVSVILNLIYFRLDTILLSIFQPASEVGLYGAAYKILEILVTFPNMFIGLILPVLSYWALHDTDRFRRIFQRAFDLLIAGGLPLVIGGLWLAEPIIVLISGQEFAAAAPVFQLLLFAVFSLFLGSLSGHAIVAIGKQRVMVWVYLCIAVLGIGVYLLLIPIFSFYGAAFGTILTETLSMSVGYFIILRNKRFTLNIWGVGRALLASACMSLVLWALHPYGLFINLIAGGFVYVGALLAFGGIRRDELLEIVRGRKKETEA